MDTRENGSFIRRKKSTETELSFLDKFKRQPIFRERMVFTASLCWSFIMLGWVESLFGPTFPDLRLIINEKLDTSSWLFTATSGGFLAGSILTGFLYDRYNRLTLLLLSIVSTAAAVAAVPWCPYFTLMLCVKFLGGMVAASLDIGANAEILSIWDRQSGPYMQALHFCFCIGGMIAPFVAQPFLASKVPVTDSDTNTTSLSLDGRGNKTYLSTYDSNAQLKVQSVSENPLNHSLGETDVMFKYSETKVHIVYLISSGLILLTAMPFACMLYTKRDDCRKKSVDVQVKRTEETGFDKLSIPKKLLILGLLSLLMVIYCGTEDTFAGFLMTFTITQLKWSKSAGSIATSVHWISFGAARLGGIFIVRFIRTSKLLYTFSLMLVVSFSCLLTATLTQMTFLIWIFIGCSGFSMSVIFPAIFMWTNENVVSVSGKISAMFITSASLGVMMFPLLFGYTMDNISPVWFLYLLLGQSVLWVVLFTLSIFVTNILIKSPVQSTTIEVEERETMQVEVR